MRKEKIEVCDINNITEKMITNFKRLDIFYNIKDMSNDNYYIIYEDKNKINIKYILYIYKEDKKLSLEGIKRLTKYISEENNINNLKIKIISFSGYEEDVYSNKYINLVLETKEYFDYISNISKEDYIDLLPHNHNVYNKIINALKSSNKTCAIQATGSGKSYLASAIIQKYKNENKIIVSSSKYILNQFTKNFNSICENTYFYTYSKLGNIIEKDIDELKKINPKVIILDEFHRAGAVEWSKGVEFLFENFPNSKFLGTSATPIRYLDNTRDMSYELFEGNISSEINLSQAIINEILPKPKYVTAFYSIDEEIDRLLKIIKFKSRTSYDIAKTKYLINSLKDINNKFCKLNIILNQHITTERNFIVFCEGETHLEEMKKILYKCFKLAFPNKEINTYKVFSTYTKSKYELKTFLEKENNNDEFNLLFTVNKINEGIHAKNIDGVILLRHTESPIIFLQQIGRAIQSLNSKKPLILDIVNNINNLSSKSFLKEIYSEYNNYKLQAEEVGISLNNLEYYLDEIYDETSDILELVKEFEISLGVGWDSMYEKLCLYKEEFGNTDVKSSYSDTSLGIWVMNQRQNYKKGLLDEEKINKLNYIGFKWDYLNDKWNELFDELIEFKLKKNKWPSKGNCNNLNLVTWVSRQRSKYQKNTLEEYKIEKLNEIGFDFEPYKNRWNFRYNKIEEGWKKYKNLDFLNLKENRELRDWVYSQRENIKKERLSSEQIKKLKKIGISDDAKEAKWLLRYEQIKMYYKTYNTKVIPVKYQGGTLKNWEKQQKKLYRLNKLSEFRKNKLDEIGFMD